MTTLRGALLGAALVFVLDGVAAAAPPDAWITTKAKIALLTTRGVSATDVNVDTVNGLVTLHGKVSSQEARRNAEAAVREIEGATQVRNLLQIVPEPREDAVAESDDQIETRVQQALRSDEMFSDVSVESVNLGVVLLAGTVETLTAHLDALETAARVRGVRRVVSEIGSPDKLADEEIYSEEHAKGAAPASGGRLSDLWITSAVKLRLLADDRTPGLGVNVDTTDGAVTLFGIVDSPQAKAAAGENARKVSGVTSVENALEVVPSLRQDAVEVDDERIEKRVETAISNVEELQDASIDVDVKNGVARLTGTVPSQAERMRAAVVARTAIGVKAVQDDLRIASR